MSPTRRGFGGIAVGTLASLAGCAAIQGATTFESEPARVPSQTQSDTGYQETDTREMTIEREVGGQQVEATNHIAEYQKEVDFGPLGSARLGVYVAFTTPAVQVAGQEFNPISEMSREELVQQIQGRYDAVESVSKAGKFEATVVGESATVGEFDAKTTYNGQEIELKILVARVKHDYGNSSDFVVPVGIYPTRKDEERGNIVTLMENTEHPAE
ncbi:MAG: DUF6517 family protein [Halolamina sp.]